jgi:outer membrane protein with beta-barrel domain
MRSLITVAPVLSLLALLALSATPALAQAPPSQQPPPPTRQTSTRSSGAEGFGIQLGGGPIFSSFDEVTGLQIDQKTGWLVGLLMGGNRGGTVGVEADVLYGQKGATINNVDFDQKVVHVPVMLKINGGSSNVNGVSLFGVGGGYFDWLFSGKINQSPADTTNGYEVGWTVGGGVEVLRFSVQARYVKGVKAIDKNFNVANSQDSKSKSFVVLFAFRLN